MSSTDPTILLLEQIRVREGEVIYAILREAEIDFAGVTMACERAGNNPHLGDPENASDLLAWFLDEADLQTANALDDEEVDPGYGPYIREYGRQLVEAGVLPNTKIYDGPIPR